MIRSLFSLCIVTLFSVNVSANSTIDRLTESMCDYVKSDDRSNIRKKLRSANLKLRHTYAGFVCQPEGDFPGGSLLRTATFYGATEVSSFLIKKMSRDDFQLEEHDGVKTSVWMKEALASGSLKDVNKAKTIYSEAESRFGE
ncbi:DUF3718 domain-containing protein [Pleionea sediminis]|uniref:DUF3718 domain-containing protein n=1 Tax=Pleionea sediminis TaxID=2569479 RepID=UPI0011857E19|nr:DUF3718 domain-containing protein [Pleionea sediminis]